jgi:hypothetical protein
MIRALPYVAALAIGVTWDAVPHWVAMLGLLACAYLVYADSKD